MKMDMVNYTIQSLQPHLQEHSIEHERAKFQELLNKQPSMYITRGQEWKGLTLGLIYMMLESIPSLKEAEVSSAGSGREKEQLGQRHPSDPKASVH